MLNSLYNMALGFSGFYRPIQAAFITVVTWCYTLVQIIFFIRYIFA